MNGSRFVRACLRQPVDRTPVWFLRQAGRYMPEYMAVRKHHTLLEICRTPQIAAEVTITAAERLGVDAAIIFADLLLPFTPMGVDFEFLAGEGPVVHTPIRTLEQIRALRTDRIDDLSYVARSLELVAKHFAAPRSDGDQLGIIGFCGAPFTLASYMIEGGSSRNYIEAKKMMYASGGAWPLLMEKLVEVLTGFARQQVEAGADVIQVFDSWAGALSVEDYREFCLTPTTQLIQSIRNMGVPSSTSASTPPRSSRPCARPAPMSSASTGARRSPRAGAPSAPAAPSRATSTPSPSSPPKKSSNAVSLKSSARPLAVPATSSTSATASCPAHPSKTSSTS